MTVPLSEWLRYCRECWECVQHPICPVCCGHGYKSEFRDFCAACNKTGRRQAPPPFYQWTKGQWT